MSALATQRVHKLAGSLVELKAKVRAALATELAGAVGIAVRDVLIVALIDRLVTPPRPAPPVSRPGGWRDDGYDRERDQWGEPKDPWADRDEYRPASRYDTGEDEAPEPSRTVPVAAAVAVGVTVGRWWVARKGSLATAVGVGALATTLGLAGGPLAHVLLAVVAAASDLLTAEAALGRADLS